jgi:Flp pilus assembly protein TadG
MSAFGVWRADLVRRMKPARLARDDRGSVAIMFALTIFVVFTLVGGAVDLGRAMVARERLQSAVDSSVLAAARVWQLENDLTLAEEKALAHFDTNKPQEVSRVVSFTPDMQASTFTMVGETTVPTPFLSLVRQSITVSTRGQAIMKSRMNLEVAMMLDVTGSMAGQRINDLKAAAKDLVDIIVQNDQSEYSTRVAIVPFSHAVNAGTTLGPHVAHNPSSSLVFKFRDNKERTWYRTNAYCVSERQGSNAYTDVSPTGNNRLPRVYYGSSSTSSCQPSTAAIPLTSNKTLLHSTIDSLSANGWTGGNLGTAWAWYMLSPTWWSGLPSDVYPENRPAGYPARPIECADWETCPDYRRVDIEIGKFAVLMTDGEYNMQFCNGSTSNTTGASIPDRNSGPGNSEKADCTSPLGSSNTQTLALCTAMKANGIKIYTIGFGLGTYGNQVELLESCASNDGHPTDPGKLFYNTQTGDELRTAFRHIATSIGALMLSR